MKAIFSLIVISAVVTAIIGWLINLFDMINLAIASAPMTTMFVLKVVGVFVAPLGAILGLFY